MRLSRLTLLIALPLSLAACGAPDAAAPADAAAVPPAERTDAAAPQSGDAAPPPMTASAAMQAPVEPVETAHEDGARQRIAALLGDAEQYEQVFTAFKAAVVAGDRPNVVEYVRFPLRVADGRQIADAGEFQRNYERIITPAVVKALQAQDFDSVFVNAQGVMVGQGQVWFNGQCLDTACTHTDVKVVTIQ